MLPSLCRVWGGVVVVLFFLPWVELQVAMDCWVLFRVWEKCYDTIYMNYVALFLFDYDSDVLQVLERNPSVVIWKPPATATTTRNKSFLNASCCFVVWHCQ